MKGNIQILKILWTDSFSQDIKLSSQNMSRGSHSQLILRISFSAYFEKNEYKGIIRNRSCKLSETMNLKELKLMLGNMPKLYGLNATKNATKKNKVDYFFRPASSSRLHGRKHESCVYKRGPNHSNQSILWTCCAPNPGVDCTENVITIWHLYTC